MRLVDLYPTQGTFSPGETIRLVAEVEAEGTVEVGIRLSLFHLAEQIRRIEYRFALGEGANEIPLEFDVSSDAPRGYGVRAELVDEGGGVVSSAETASDVLDSWTDYPRYGFLTDFAPNRDDMDEIVANLARFHINGLQFYDWQYRHDCLLPPSEIYSDSLGRELSLDTVRRFIGAAHEHGIAAMPYLAIYAASMEFWAEHPDWRLLDAKGEPLLFEDFLGIMDPSPGGAWVNHLLGECERTLTTLDFNGVHIDQYGDPKDGFSVGGEEVDIPGAFHAFITAAKERFPKPALTFNAVGNWPIDALATAPLDFNYIEIWAAMPTFRDLRCITLESRLKSADKPVVIALYLPVDQEANIRLADAIIFASGGCRIELGERDRLLTDPYFPKHQAIPSDLNRILRRYYDFAVRYGEWMGPSARDVQGLGVNLPEGVWGVIRETEGWLVLHLINGSGLGDPRWDEAIPAPSPQVDLSVEILMPEPIRAIWWANPDRDDLTLKPAKWRAEDDRVVVDVPYLDYWSMLAVQIEELE